MRHQNKSVTRTYSKLSAEHLYNIPFESAKSSCSLRRAADMSKAEPIAQKDRERNEAGEPEYHGYAFDAGNDAGVVELGFGEAHGDHDQVGQSDQSDYRAKEEEAD